MHYDLLSDADKTLLVEARFSRLFDLLPLLKLAEYTLDRDYNLHIYLESEDDVEAMLAVEPQAKELFHLVLGALHFCIYLSGKPTYQDSVVPALLPAGIELEATVLEDSVMAGVIEREAIAPIARQAIREQTMSAVDTIVDQEIQRFMEEEAPQLVSDRVAQRLSVLMGGTAQLQLPEAKPEATPEATQNGNGKVQADATEQSTALKLPSNFRDRLSNNYGRVIEALLPDDEGDRQTYLKAITEESEEGKQWLDKVAKGLHKKLKRSSAETYYAGLLKKAKQLV